MKTKDTEPVIQKITEKEQHRIETILKLKSKQITQKQASEILKISTRQIRRLTRTFEKNGINFLLSKKRGTQSNNKIPEQLKQQTIQIIKEKYQDFGPTFTSEKLLQNYNIKLSRETLRNWMIEENIHYPKKRKQPKKHPLRERRSCYGELIQIDGSPHDWFEGRAPKCCLIVFIDDATSKILHLHFAPSETTNAYFQATKDYIQKHGLPMSLYSDKDSIFKVNNAQDEEITQFKRALDTLKIELICANSPQAKGRVERANKTLQDRLVKEMRLLRINTIEQANAYLPKYTEYHNKKFSEEPKNPQNLHRKTTLTTQQLNQILCNHHQRKLTKNLELSFKNKIYQIQINPPSYMLRRATVDILEDLNGDITILYKNKNLPYKIFTKQNKLPILVDTKTLNQTVDTIRKYYKPAQNHPWRQYRTPMNL